MFKPFIILIVFFVVSSSHAGEPKIVNEASKQEVILGAEAEKAIKSYDAIFKPYIMENFAPTVQNLFKDLKNELPMAVIGDFNADKKMDLALLGTNKMKELTLILLAEKNGYKVIEVRSTPYKKPSASTIPAGEEGTEETGLGFYLGLAKASDLKFKKNSVTSVRDGLQTEYYGGETKVFYINSKNKLTEYTGLIP